MSSVSLFIVTWYELEWQEPTLRVCICLFLKFCLSQVIHCVTSPSGMQNGGQKHVTVTVEGYGSSLLSISAAFWYIGEFCTMCIQVSFVLCVSTADFSCLSFWPCTQCSISKSCIHCRDDGVHTSIHTDAHTHLHTYTETKHACIRTQTELTYTFKQTLGQLGPRGAVAYLQQGVDHGMRTRNAQKQ